MRISLRYLLPALAAIVAAALVVAWLNASGGTTARLSASTTQPPTQAACGHAKAGQMECLSIYRTGNFEPQTMAPNTLPKGWGPTGLKQAYNLTSLTAGKGRTVAVVDAYNDPNAQSDLAAYRAKYGLPKCTYANGCLKKVNQTGGKTYPANNASWSVEISLDLDMVSAICPYCKITLVEAKTASAANLGAAENEAVKLGAKFVSNSWGGPEQSGEAGALDHFFNHPGVAITFSAGDNGFEVDYPAASRYVTAVGGTSLHRDSTTTRGWRETVWNGTGSGCSADSTNAKPTWQHDTGCANRTVGDVAADADPATGVAIYDTVPLSGLNKGWNVVGGTSVSAPIIAAVYARANVPVAGTYPASYPYSHPTLLWDVTSGSNGTCSPAYLCTGQAGYDGPTGLGTPNSAAGFKH